MKPKEITGEARTGAARLRSDALSRVDFTQVTLPGMRPASAELMRRIEGVAGDLAAQYCAGAINPAELLDKR